MALSRSKGFDRNPMGYSEISKRMQKTTTISSSPGNDDSADNIADPVVSHQNEVLMMDQLRSYQPPLSLLSKQGATTKNILIGTGISLGLFYLIKNRNIL